MGLFRRSTLAASLLAPLVISSAATADPAKKGEASSIERGRYVVTLGGCNDCHTPGYVLSGGKVPEKDWLTGDALGWRGPWGTTYPGNLRRYVGQHSEDEWVKMARTTEYRPPMPWFTLRKMKEQDLRAAYRFIRHLGPAGEAAPAFVPPDKEPQGPFVLFPAPPK